MQVPGAVRMTMPCTVHPPHVHSCSALLDTGSLYCGAGAHTTGVSPTGQTPKVRRPRGPVDARNDSRSVHRPCSTHVCLNKRLQASVTSGAAGCRGGAAGSAGTEQAGVRACIVGKQYPVAFARGLRTVKKSPGNGTAMYGLTVTLKVLELICRTLPWFHTMAAPDATQQFFQKRAHARQG